MKFTIKRYNGKLISRPYKGHSIQYLDQLSDSDNIWVCSGVFNRYLKKTYDLTCKEYYNLVMYGESSISSKCSNPNCSNSASFISLSRGYHKTCGCNECKSHLLSIHCKNQHMDENSSLNISLSRVNNSDEFKKKASDRFKSINESNWKNPEYVFIMKDKSYNTINSWRSKCKSKYSVFLKQGKPEDVCIFYIGLTNSNDIKFGVTGVNLDKGRCNRKWRLKLKSIHRLVVSDRITVAKIELNLKFHFQSNSEYVEFSKLREIIDFVRNYK